MRKITRQATNAFMARIPFKSGNMQVEVLPTVTILKLHGNNIAYLYPNGKLEITSASWNTNTTKERLNALPGVSIYQRNFQWYLNDLPWDGSLVSVGSH